MKKNLKQKLMYGLTIGCVVLALGGIALASDQTPSKGQRMGMPCVEQRGQMMEQHVSDSLKNLVEQGKISQSQADQILSVCKAQAAEHQADFAKMRDMSREERQTFMEQHRSDRDKMWSDIKTSANLSEEQAKAVAEALRPPFAPGKKEFGKNVKDQLNQLVAQNTITQSQEDQVLAFIKTKMEEHRADFEKVKDMSPEERHAFMQQHRPDKAQMLAELKEAANMNDEQAKAVAEALRPPFAPGPREFGKHVKDQLNQLVAQNTITQLQEDQVLAFFKAKMEEHRADFEKVKDMTPVERHAFMQQHKPDMAQMLAELKEAAQLNDEQAAAVMNSCRPQHDRHHSMMRNDVSAPQQ